MVKRIHNRFIVNKRFKFLVKYTILFAFMCFFCFLPFILGHKSFVQKDDGFNQSLPIFVYIGRYYRNIIKNIIIYHTIPIYDFSVGLGGGVFAELDGYGILDLLLIPFAVLTPAKFAAFGYTLMCVFKMYLGGIGYYVYLRRKKYYEEPAIAASFFFVFNCYTYAFGIMFPDFFNVIVYLPFIIMGIDSVFNMVIDSEEKSNRLFIALGTIAIFLHSLTGFYFIYMEILFSGCYVLYKLCTIKEIGVSKKIKVSIYLTVYFFLGVALSAFIFIPELQLFFTSSRAGSSSIGLQSFISLYNGKELTERFATIGIGKWGMGLGVCIVGIICLIHLFKEKGNLSLKVTAVMAIIAYFNKATGSITNGFSYSVDRYIFMIYFVFGVIICHELQIMKKITFLEAMVTVVFVLAIAYAHFYSSTEWQEYVTRRSVLYIFVSICVFMLLKIGDHFLADHHKHMVFYSLVCLISIIFVAIGYNYNRRVGGMEWSSMFMRFSEVSDGINYSQYGKVSFDLANDDDNSFERLDIGETSYGASFFTGTNSTTAYLSMIEPAHCDFLSEYGVSTALKRSFLLNKLDGRANMEMLLSVRKYTDGVNGEVITNRYYLPMGVVFDSYISAEDVSGYSILEKNALLSKTVVIEGEAKKVRPYDGGIVSSLIEQVPIRVIYEGIDSDNDVISVSDQSEISITFEQSVSGLCEYYLCIHDFMSLNGVHDISIADKNLRIPNELVLPSEVQDVYVKIPDRYVKEGVVTISFHDNGNYRFSDVTIEKMNLESLAADHQKLSRNTLQNMNFDGKRVTGTIALDSSGILFMSIPYSPKWKCYIDGAETRILKADTGFSAVEMDPGEHDVRFEYYYFK